MNSIERSVFIRAPKERVWRAISDVKEFSAWFGVVIQAQAFVPGERIQMESTHEKAQGIRWFIEMDEMVPNERLSWRWHPGMPDERVDYSKEPMTKVTFTLAAEPGGTLLTVRETGFESISLARRAAVFADNTSGWEHQMKAVEQYVSREN